MGLDSLLVRSFLERICNYFLGLSVIGWAVMGLLHESPDVRFSSVRCTISALNLVVGSFILIRMPVKQHGSIQLILAALPSLLIGGFAFKLSPQPALWSVSSQVLFSVGGVVAAGSFLFLVRVFLFCLR